MRRRFPTGDCEDAASRAVLRSSSPGELELRRVRRAGEGDAGAQSWLVQLLLGRVRRIAGALCANPSDIDDSVQLSMLAILRAASAYRGDASIANWAKRIAVRTTMRNIKRERRKRGATLDDSTVARLVAPEAPRYSEDLPRSLLSYLDELPVEQRDVLVLHHALGYSYAEISELTSVSANTVKGRLRLGTASLRKNVRRELFIGRPRPNDVDVKGAAEG